MKLVIQGFEVVKESLRDHHFGKFYEAVVQSNGPASGSRRIVRVIDLTDISEESIRENIVKGFEARVSTLLKKPLQHVSMLLDAGYQTGNRLYTVGVKHDIWLYDIVQDHEGSDKINLKRAVGQLLTGLASLHANGISYGDLRLEDISGDLDENHGISNIWITGVEFGCLTQASNGELLRGGRSFFPPESSGSPPLPTERTDLYALGQLICQIAGGREAITENQSPAEVTEKIKDKAIKKLVQKHLLAKNPTDRPANAGEALKKLQEIRQSQRRKGALVAFLLLLLGIVPLGWFLRNSSSETISLQEKVSALRDANASQANVIQELKNRVATLTEKNNKRPEVIKQPILQVENPTLPSKNTIRVNYELESARIFKELATLSSDAEINTDRWLKGQLADKPDAEEKGLREHLDKWIAEFEPTRKYKLIVHAVTVSEEHSVDNLWMNVKSDDAWAKNPDDVADDMFFTASKLQELPSSQRQFQFSWRRGREIEISLGSDYIWSNPVHLNKKYKGPYAIWLLHKDGQKLVKDNTTLKFEVLKCPGPDRTLFKPIASPLRRKTTKTNKK